MTAPDLSHSEEKGRTLARQPQIWGAAPLRNPDFVGREELLEQLRIRQLYHEIVTTVPTEALCAIQRDSVTRRDDTVQDDVVRRASTCWVRPYTTRLVAVIASNWMEVNVMIRSRGDPAAQMSHRVTL